ALKGTFKEMREGTWVQNAQRRASRRKSPWNLLLLLIFPLWWALWWAMVEVGCLLHFVLNHEGVPPWREWMHLMGGSMTVPQALIAFGPMIPTLTGAMVIGNFLIYQIPSARRAMDVEDRGHPGTAYQTAQRALGQITLYGMPIAVILLLLGAWWMS
ncbi:MAG: hypothetical protein WBE52_19560, partial [Terriglobales bacterium]